MKRIVQTSKLALIGALMTILLASSFTFTFASASIPEQDEDLPDFLLKLSERFSDGNATKLALMREQMRMQLKHNEEIIASTDGAVLKGPSGSRSYTTLSSVSWIWEYHGGYVDYEERMTGFMDTSYAHMHTNEPHAETWVVGPMSGSSTGNIYAYAKAGPHSTTGWQNIVFAYVSNSTSEYADWQWLGYCGFTYSIPAYGFLGNWAGSFSAILVGSFSYYETDHNCASIDMIYAAGPI